MTCATIAVLVSLLVVAGTVAAEPELGEPPSSPPAAASPSPRSVATAARPADTRSGDAKPTEPKRPDARPAEAKRVEVKRVETRRPEPSRPQKAEPGAPARPLAAPTPAPRPADPVAPAPSTTAAAASSMAPAEHAATLAEAALESWTSLSAPSSEAAAERVDDGAAGGGIAAPTSGASLAALRVVGAAVVVALLLAAGAVGLRRFAAGRGWPWKTGAPAGPDAIELTSRAVVGPREFLTLVKIGEERFLVGVTPTSISLVSRLRPTALDAGAPSTALSDDFPAALDRARATGAVDGGSRPVSTTTPEAATGRAPARPEDAVRHAVARARARLDRFGARAGEARG